MCRLFSFMQSKINIFVHLFMSIWFWSSGCSLHMFAVDRRHRRWRDSCAREELLLACSGENKESLGEVCMCTSLTKLQLYVLTQEEFQILTMIVLWKVYITMLRYTIRMKSLSCHYSGPGKFNSVLTFVLQQIRYSLDSPNRPEVR